MTKKSVEPHDGVYFMSLLLSKENVKIIRYKVKS